MIRVLGETSEAGSFSQAADNFQQLQEKEKGRECVRKFAGGGSVGVSR